LEIAIPQIVAKLIENALGKYVEINYVNDSKVDSD